MHCPGLEQNSAVKTLLGLCDSLGSIPSPEEKHTAQLAMITYSIHSPAQDTEDTWFPTTGGQWKAIGLPREFLLWRMRFEDSMSPATSDLVSWKLPLPQPGPQLLYSVSFTTPEPQQPVLLRTMHLTLIRAAVKHSPPSFVLHYPQGRKISYDRHFTPTSQTRWDSAIPEAAGLVSA